MTVPVFDINTVPEKDRERVAALIPDPRVAEQYINRHPDGIEDFEMLDKAIERKRNVLLWGPTGSAKTLLFRAYASSRRLPYIAVEFNGSMDKQSLLGKVDGVDPVTGLTIWRDGQMTLVLRYGGVCVFEEVNMASGRINAGFHGITGGARRMDLPENNETIWGGHGGHDHKDVEDEDGKVVARECLGEPQPLLIGANFNPRKVGYEGTLNLGQAFKNRFADKHEWPYVPEVERQILLEVYGAESAALADLAAHVRSLEAVRTDLSTNMLMEFVEFVEDFGIDYAIARFVKNFEQGTEADAVDRALKARSAQIAVELGVDVPEDVFNAARENAEPAF